MHTPRSLQMSATLSSSMKSSPLTTKPEFVSLFNVVQHPQYEAAVTKKAKEYFFSRWPWASQKQKELYLQHDLEVPFLITCPRASEERAELIVEFLFFTFALDDFTETAAHDEVVRTVEGINRVLREGHPPQNAIENIMHDLSTRMLSLGDHRSRELAKVIFVHTARWLDVAINDVDRRKALEQGLDVYLRYRHTDLGIPCLYAIYPWELDLGAPPDYFLSDLDFNILRSLAGDTVILINDMYSYRHEVRLLEDKRRALDKIGDKDKLRDAPEGYVCNVVCMLLREDGVDETNVMDRLGMIIHGKESDFLATADKLRGRYQDHAEDLVVIEAWIEILTNMMAGNYIWSSTCGRYNSI